MVFYVFYVMGRGGGAGQRARDTDDGVGKGGGQIATHNAPPGSLVVVEEEEEQGADR